MATEKPPTGADVISLEDARKEREEARKTGASEATAAERARVKGIHELVAIASAGRDARLKETLMGLAAKCIEDGTSLDDARTMFVNHKATEADRVAPITSAPAEARRFLTTAEIYDRRAQDVRRAQGRAS